MRNTNLVSGRRAISRYMSRFSMPPPRRSNLVSARPMRSNLSREANMQFDSMIGCRYPNGFDGLHTEMSNKR